MSRASLHKGARRVRANNRALYKRGPFAHACRPASLLGGAAPVSAINFQIYEPPMSRSLTAPVNVGCRTQPALRRRASRLNGFCARALLFFSCASPISRYFQEPRLLVCHESMAHLLRAPAVTTRGVSDMDRMLLSFLVRGMSFQAGVRTPRRSILEKCLRDSFGTSRCGAVNASLSTTFPRARPKTLYAFSPECPSCGFFN